MQNEIKEIEYKISHSPLFSLDKNTQKTAYRKETLRMVEYLYTYLITINKAKYEPYGYEITATAKDCINAFKSEKGDFLHYFNRAWKNAYRKIKNVESDDKKYRGLVVDEDSKKWVRKYNKFSEKFIYPIGSQKHKEEVAEELGVSINKAEKIIELQNLRVESDEIYTEDGDVVNITDFYKQAPPADRKLLQKERDSELLHCIQNCFDMLQERQKPIISDLMTSRLCGVVTEMDIDVTEFSFLNKDMLYKFVKCGTSATQREIAAKYYRDEASLSRSLWSFMNKIKKNI